MRDMNGICSCKLPLYAKNIQTLLISILISVDALRHKENHILLCLSVQRQG